MDGILIIRQPQTRKEFELMYDLRWRVLRKPWNQPKGSEKDELELEANHFIALIHDEIVGTARLHRLNENVAQVRYLAVAENYRGKGIAGKIFEAIHLTAKNQFIRYLILNARESAVKFFEKIGYKVIDEGPLLFGEIKHKKMMASFTRSDLRMKQIVDNLKKTL